MNKNFITLMLFVATTSHVAVAQNVSAEGFKSRAIALLTQGADKTKSFIGSTVNGVKAVPGSSKNFIFNNPKSSLLLATVTTYASAEFYNYKKGKPLYAQQAWNWTTTTHVAKNVADAYNASKAWLTKKYHAWVLQLDDLKEDIQELKDFDLKQNNQNIDLLKADIAKTTENLKLYFCKEDAFEIIKTLDIDGINQKIASLEKQLRDINITQTNIQKALTTPTTENVNSDTNA